MRDLPAILKEHRHFVIVITLLTLVVTFPTIVYVFRADVAWLPTGRSADVFIKLWDIWYAKQFLSGQADRFHTNLMFYPEGLSLTYHPFFIPHVIVANALNMVMPLTNAYSLAHLLIIWTTAFSAYIYLRWLFNDKWIALFGAVVFGFSPHVLSHPNHPDIAFLATIPLVLYFFQRGIKEGRPGFAIVSGLFLGLTTVTSLYAYVCAAIMIGLLVCFYAFSNWRKGSFWGFIFLLLLAAGLSSLWRVYPLARDGDALQQSMDWYGEGEGRSDLISNLASRVHPVYGPVTETIFQTPEGAKITESSFLGYLPLLLIGAGLLLKTTRMRMLSWTALCAVFLILRLGSALNVNGTVIESARLPKYYLNQILPFLFRPFVDTDTFMMGALLPFSVLTCYGVVALGVWRPALARPAVILLFTFFVAFEYYIPIVDNPIPLEQFNYMDWLDAESESDEVRLINVPMGRRNAKRYNFYQALNGYPQAEGFISRTPDSAFDYIRANPILEVWNRKMPIACSADTMNQYLPAIDQLESDGFSHVVFHQNVGNPLTVVDSFKNAEPSYRDDFVWIYRLDDLRESCPI